MIVLGRIGSLPGLEILAADADTLVEVCSGTPQLILPARVRIR